ncbi:2'-5' RNA ligase family protein [Streptomyces verrucosisporus]|uniref:2'-5' RNA ligase family protein n=1 Tax=Streptomyces verrucosisporus TaxID=1695161 RepID=UPI001F125D47|nr:2'-5' RNA ligase family protein [Streptomyces verrucosisporus]
MTAETMADHWWWRPGWKPGRRFYTWHFTFRTATEVHRLADAYRRGLADVPGLALVPDRWLHLTMQGLGFVDEVPEQDARAIADAARRRLAGLAPFQLRLHQPEITPEAIRWEAEPSGPPAAVRAAVRAAIADVWDDVPEPADGFAPHVTIAYSNGDGPADPVARALEAVDVEPATARIEQVDLIVLGRDDRMYEWEDFAAVRLG